MDADAVLTEEQRQLRFRKVIERKTVQRTQTTSDSNPGNSSEGMDDAQMRSPTRHVRSNLFPPLPPPQLIPNWWTKILKPKIAALVRTYETTLGADVLGDGCSKKMFEKFDSIFAGNVQVKIERQEIICYLNKMSEEFSRFAELQR
jgi:hypothetical protein